MRRNMKQELRRSMDELHFSARDKEEMTKMLMNNYEKQSRRSGGRKMLVLALAAALALMTMTAAGVYTKWSRTARNQYTVSEDVKDQAAKSGLSVMLLDEGKTGPSDVVSATDQGITVTAVQSLVDEHKGELIFRVEGFDLPEGKCPDAWFDMTIDGNEHFYTSMSPRFFEGLTRNSAGETVYASTGKPVESDENGTWILDYMDAEGALEYIISFTPSDTIGSLDGKEAVVRFHAFGVQSDEPVGESSKTVEGNWELRWDLSSASESLKLTPNAKIGESGVTLLTAEVGQKSIVTTYQLERYWNGWETLEQLPMQVRGVRMKDGTVYHCYGMTEGYDDMDQFIFRVESTMEDGLLDLSQVESLMFQDQWAPTENSGYVYIPIG